MSETSRSVLAARRGLVQNFFDLRHRKCAHVAAFPGGPVPGNGHLQRCLKADQRPPAEFGLRLAAIELQRCGFMEMMTSVELPTNRRAPQADDTLDQCRDWNLAVFARTEVPGTGSL